MKNSIMVLGKATVTGLLFYFLFRDVDFHQFGATLRNARWDVLLAGFVILWAGHYICIFRWRMLMRPLMPALSLAHLFGIYCIGLFFNLTFPTVVGGDVVKMYYAGKPSRRFAQSFAATFLDRDAEMLAMMIIACSTTLFFTVEVPGVPVELIIWSAFATFIFMNLIIFMPSMHRRFTALLQRLRIQRLARKIDTLSAVFQVMGKQPNVLLYSLAISLINQMLVISVTWIMADGLRLKADPLYFLIFVPVITLISMKRAWRWACCLQP
jgi:uncharacterized protein (TIRG00374 family)